MAAVVYLCAYTIEVTDSQKKILQQRLAAYKASPNEGTSWEIVKKEMQ